MNPINEHVLRYLSHSGKSKSELAKYLGISRQSLRAKLSGNVGFKLSEGEKLANLMGCSIDEMLKPIVN